jgi:hypothetical protein
LLTLSLLLPMSPFSLHPAAAATPNTGVIIPLYSYPSSAWNAIIQAKESNPSVPIIAVVNPDNGPGASYDSNYAAWIGRLQAAGVTVLGYVYTSYASRSIPSVETDMLTYKSWYNVQGIFFDQMSNVLGKQSYYSTLNSYATTVGYTFTVANPGGPVPSAFVGSVDCIIIYENSGAPTLPQLAAASMGMNKNNFAFIGYNSQLSSSYVSSSSSYVSYMFLTQETMPNPYSSLPSYLSSLVSDLGIPPTASLTVQSVGPGGQPLVGMWTTVTSAGKTVATGFTPLTITANVGQQYSVTVSNYGNDYFSHWGDGSTGSTDTLTVSGATALTAYYTGSLEESLTVDSITTSGAPLNGMWTVIQSNGNVVASGFTPLTFSGTEGSVYTVTVSNYGNDQFSYWTPANTNPSLVLTLDQDTTVTATYST